MTISTRSKPYVIPRYSLTGDLLAFLECKLQYRYNSKGSLPPSTPVQRWFGEFIHGVMEESFRKWKKGELQFPCTFDDVQLISIEISRRLAAKGLKPYYGIFSEKDTPKRKCKDFIANARAFQSVSVWGKHLFPLVERNEVKLEGMRDMPDYDKDFSRAGYYAVTGIADVITSVKLNNTKIRPDNRIISSLKENDEVRKLIEENQEFEIIVDYKGTSRPDTTDKIWKHHEWQINTYMWLREAQLVSEGEKRPIVAGILLYLNELIPAKDDYKKMILSMHGKSTDVIASGIDFNEIAKGKLPTREFRERRSIRIIPYDKENIEQSLKEFDTVVSKIEHSIQSETRDSGNVMKHWCGNEYSKERCTACDAKSFCQDLGEKNFMPPKVP